jgi:PIN domain nuclease of toxin-antitoxin system
MSALVADAHATLWYLLNSPNLSLAAATAMDAVIQAGDAIVVASITLVEIAYLVEKARVLPTAFDLVTRALGNLGSGLVLAALDLPVSEAVRRVPRQLVPDMPDRFITATAMHLGLPLVTADRRIRSSGIATIW